MSTEWLSIRARASITLTFAPVLAGTFSLSCRTADFGFGQKGPIQTPSTSDLVAGVITQGQDEFASDDGDDIVSAGNEFAYEQHLRDYLAKNLGSS